MSSSSPSLVHRRAKLRSTAGHDEGDHFDKEWPVASASDVATGTGNSSGCSKSSSSVRARSSTILNGGGSTSGDDDDDDGGSGGGTSHASESRASTPICVPAPKPKKLSHTLTTSSMSSSSILPPANAAHVQTNGYRRLYSELSSPFLSSRVRNAWKKALLGAAVLIMLAWIFGHRERREALVSSLEEYWKSAHFPSTSSTKPKIIPHSLEEDPDPLKTVYCSTPYDPTLPLVQYALMIDAGSTGSRIHIYKFNNCDPPPSSPYYEYEVFAQTQPGLSDYANNALGAAASLDVLLYTALRTVPNELWRCTPVAVKATAGLRMLGKHESGEILREVRSRLKEKFPFPLGGGKSEEDSVVIMDGRDEGVYAWITANYLLGTIRSDATSSLPSTQQSSHTYAVLDLGGASTQIVFEPDFPDASGNEATVLMDGEHKYELQFGGKTYVLYQHSYLGFGLMKVRKSVHRLVDFMSSFHVHEKRAQEQTETETQQGGIDPDSDGDGEEQETGQERNRTEMKTETQRIIANPCLWRGSKRRVELELSHPGETKRTVIMDGTDIGSFEACNRIVELVLSKDAVCPVKPCSFNGVYQPSVLETFSGPGRSVLLLSYFYDRLAPFFPSATFDYPDVSKSNNHNHYRHSNDEKASIQGRGLELTISSLASLAHTICAGPDAWAREEWGTPSPSQIASQHTDILNDLRGRPETCLDLTYMHALLKTGYEFSSLDASSAHLSGATVHTLRLGKRVKDTEMGWALGATVVELVGRGAGIRCQA